MGNICLKLISHCNSRSGTWKQISGGSGALKGPTIDDIELSDKELEIVDTEE